MAAGLLLCLFFTSLAHVHPPHFLPVTMNAYRTHLNTKQQRIEIQIELLIMCFGTGRPQAGQSYVCYSWARHGDGQAAHKSTGFSAKCVVSADFYIAAH
ncbi:hypothetical protein EDB19DRAFT_1120059 [Suillus lakei]|nr:hypothetical protein EDB19DRAFT_1120059 [Suillus lakei]